MQRFKTGALIASLVCLNAAASAQLRIVNYNVASLGGVPSALEAVFSSLAADDKTGFAAAPHAYMFQEVRLGENTSLAATLAAAHPGIAYTQAIFTLATGEDGSGGGQALFFRTDTFTEDTLSHIDLDTGAGRRTDRWRLKLVGYDNPPVYVYVYSSHLKAGTASSDESTRMTGAQTIRNNSDLLAAGTNIIYAGDYNVYDNAEGAYLEMLSVGNGQAIDPLGSGSWAGAGNALKHTQSPQVGGPLVGGGMDDRFDLQLVTAALNDGEGLALIPGTYRAFGNDGLHYDQAINAGNNLYYPTDLARSNALADVLFDASDHVPVINEYQVPAKASSSLPASFGRVIFGAALTVPATISNVAAAQIASGADELDFSATGTGALSGTQTGTVAALGPPAVRDFAVSTAALGAVVGTLTVSTTSPEAQTPTQVLVTTGTVVIPSNASFDPAIDANARTISRIVESDSGVATFDVPVYNYFFNSLQALLDVDGVTGVAAPYAYTGGAAQGIGATPATLQFSLDTAGLDYSTQTGVISISVSDEDIPGASAGTLTLTLQTITRKLLADTDGDCDVDLSDLGLVLSVFGKCAADAGFESAVDFDGTGCIDLSDLGLSLAQFGVPCPD